jgi:hypothetical protein
MFHSSARPFGYVQPVVVQADGLSDVIPGHAEAGRWMTYDELATSRGIDRLSAVKLALRHGWRKQRDKYRVARVCVPSEWAIPRPVEGRGKEADTGADSALGSRSFEAAERVRQATEARARQSDQARAVERLMWRERLARERERAEHAEGECGRLLAVVDGLETRLVAAEARADAAVSRALAAESDRVVAEARADAERTRADALDQAAAGESARADTLKEQAEVAETALATERGRTDALRGRIDELKGLLGGVLRAQRLRHE